MGMAQLVVTAVLVERRSRSEVARTYGVSRRWVITLVQRFLAEGEPGLAPRSRRPRSSPARTAQAVEDEIVALRKDLDRGGHEAGAATIAAHLEQRHGPDGVPATSTIWRILSARGFVTPQPHKRPKSSFQRFCADAPNERWQLDITHYRLADDTWPMTPTSRSSTSSTTTPGSASPPPPAGSSPPATSTPPSPSPQLSTGTRRACCQTTGRCSPAPPAAAAESPSRSPATPAGSGSPTPGRITRRPAGKSSGSTRR